MILESSLSASFSTVLDGWQMQHELMVCIKLGNGLGFDDVQNVVNVFSL
jgi:hypothetical protein